MANGLIIVAGVSQSTFFCLTIMRFQMKPFEVPNGYQGLEALRIFCLQRLLQMIVQKTIKIYPYKSNRPGCMIKMCTVSVFYSCLPIISLNHLCAQAANTK